MNIKFQGWIEKDGGVIFRFPLENEIPFNYYEKIAAFNLHNTLINLNDTLISKTDNDIEFTYQNCLNKLYDFNSQSYSIIIISDQPLLKKGIILLDLSINQLVDH